MDDVVSLHLLYDTISTWIKRKYGDNDYDVENNVVCAYRFGSRVYGTVKPTSDHDFIVVLKTPFNGYTTKRSCPTSSIVFPHVEDNKLLDISLIEYNDFVDMVREHRHEALEALFAPSDHVLKKDVSIPLELDKDVLRRTVLYESLQRFGIAIHKYKNGKKDSAKKDIVHSIRYLMFATQILLYKKIVNFEAANNYYRIIMDAEEVDWSECRKMRETEIEAFRKAGTPFYRLNTRTGVTQRILRQLREEEIKKGKSSLHCIIRNEIVEKGGKNESIMERKRVLEKVECERRTTKEREGILGDVMVKEQEKMKEKVYKGISLSKHHPLKIIEQLHSMGSVSRVLAEYPHMLCAQRLLDHTNLVHLSYNQFEPSLPSELFVCRSLIVDIENHFNVVAYGLPSIPHLSESHITNIFPDTLDFSKDVCVYHKVDGVRVSMYWYNDEWYLVTDLSGCNTRSMTGRAGECTNPMEVPIPLYQLFWKTWKYLGYSLPSHHPTTTSTSDKDTIHHISTCDENKKYTNISHSDVTCDSDKYTTSVHGGSWCYTFVLTSPQYRFLVKHKYADILLISVRDLNTWKEHRVEQVAESMGWHYPPPLTHYTSLHQLYREASVMNPFKVQGFIIYINNFGRYQILGTQTASILMGGGEDEPPCLSLNHGLNEKLYVHIARNNLHGVFTIYFPHLVMKAQHAWDLYNTLAEDIQHAFDAIQSLDNRDFGNKANNYWFRRVLFALKRECWISAREYLGLLSENEYQILCMKKKAHMKRIRRTSS